MSRVVVGKVDWARPCEKPASIPKSRPRGSKADGLRYEKLVAKAIPEARHGTWFEFHDVNGYGYCQPDLIIVGLRNVLVIECKLSNYFEGFNQIERLYKPVLREAYGLPVAGAVVLKSLRSDVPGRLVCSTMQGAFELLRSNQACVPLVHWLGRFSGQLAIFPDPIKISA